MKSVAFYITLALTSQAPLTAASERAKSAQITVPAGTYVPLFGTARGNPPVAVPAFNLDSAPVTNAAFAAFVADRPEWRRKAVNPLLADAGYLSQWSTPDDPGAALSDRPVVGVSLHAAKPYCRWRGARLPSDLEWQYAAFGAGGDFQERLLAWYSRSAATALPPAAGGEPNPRGLLGMYGPVWEWVADFNSLMVTGDARDDGSSSGSRFCGGAAIGAAETRDYVVFMRSAYLSALEAQFTTSSLGFRCAGNQ
jgi:formylglycine-generating enzyme required for sulfatase activity